MINLTAKGWIFFKLKEAGRPLAVHEIEAPGYSQNNIATRCAEMAKSGVLVGETRPGTRYKEWRLAA